MNQILVKLGDEILAVNGSILHGLSHSDAIAIFKSIRTGPVVIQIARRSSGTSSATRDLHSVSQSGRLKFASQMLKEETVNKPR